MAEDEKPQSVATQPLTEDEAREEGYPLLDGFEDWSVGPKWVLLELRSIGKGPDGELAETSERLVFPAGDGLNAFLMELEARGLVTRARNAWGERMKEGTTGG